MDTIPPGMEFPPGAVNGVIANVYEHTIAFQPPGVSGGGRVSEPSESSESDTESNGGESMPATPTPAPTQVSAKRKKVTFHNARRRNRLSLPAPDPDSVANFDRPATYQPPFEPQQIHHNELGVLEVALVQLQFPASSEPADQPVTHARRMFQIFNDGEKMLLALQLLANVSSARDTLTPALSLPVTTPFSSSPTPATATTFARMLAASRVAQRFLKNAEINPALLRLQTLMCYITLYLTMEYAVVPELKRNHPTWGTKRLGGQKYTYFYELLNGNRGGDNDSRETVLRKLSVDISFGKTYWSLLQDLGVAALLMLAVAEPGLTVFARAMGPGGSQRAIFTSALSSSRGWWSFAHAIGPATFRTFFGPRDIQYTVPELLHQLRAEPLPTASILLINQSCLTQKIGISAELANEEHLPRSWTLGIGDARVKIMRHPDTSMLAQGQSRGSVWQWLGTDPRSKPVVELLLPSGGGNSDQVIDLFCDLYNRRAVPGRRAVPITYLVKLSDPDTERLTFQEKLDILTNEQHSNCELLVLPAPVDDMYLAVALHPMTTTATIYNWTEKRELVAKVSKVGCPT